MRASCHPRSGVHSTVSMWSVKCVPKPGLARISASSASERGCAAGTKEMSRVMRGGYLSGTVVEPVETTCGCQRWFRQARPPGLGAGYSRGDRVADLGGAALRGGVTLGQVGDDRVLDPAGG